MENKETNSFSLTYSAKTQEEIRSIRKKYTSVEENEDKLATLRRLDAQVNSRASTVALIVGIIGALILGCGMSLIMTDIGSFISDSQIALTIIGVCLGVVGLLLVCSAYPLYNRTLSKERERIAPEIIRLSDELLNA